MVSEGWKGAEAFERNLGGSQSVLNVSRMKREGSGETLSFLLWGPKRVWRT